MLSHYCLLYLEKRGENTLTGLFLKSLCKHNQISALVWVKKQIKTRCHFHISDWQTWKSLIKFSIYNRETDTLIYCWSEYKWEAKLTTKSLNDHILWPRNSTARNIQFYLLHLITITIYTYTSACYIFFCYAVWDI